MDSDTQNTDPFAGPGRWQALRQVLLRFSIAGLFAVIVTIILLYLMRYLMVGYDDSSTAALTEYFNLRTVVLDNAQQAQRVRVQRPQPEPDSPAVDTPDFMQEAKTFLHEHAFASVKLSAPKEVIKKDILLPAPAAVPATTREKLKLIKQGIYASGR